jgi:type IV secretion system protein VirB6
MDPAAFPLFLLISNYVRSQFDSLMSSAFAGVIADIAGFSFVAVSLWVMYRGFQIAAGNERANMTDFVYKSGKIVLIVALINAAIAGNTGLQDLVFGIRSQIITAVTGNTTAGGQQVEDGLQIINLSFAAGELLGGIIDGDTAANGGGLKGTAVGFALAGQASPQIAAGVLLLINEMSIRIGILLLPLFLFFLIFEKTQDLFYSWARTMIGSFFNLAILALTIGIAAGLVPIFVAAMLALAAAGAATNSILSEIQGTVLQAGFGVLLTALIFTIPFIAGKYFTFILDAGGGSNMFSNLSQSTTNNNSQSSSYQASAAAAQQAQAASTASQRAAQPNLPTSQAGASNPMTGGTSGGAARPGS